MIDIDRILPNVTRPARYTGGEWNSIKKDWGSVDCRIALAYPEVYDIGMSNMGISILYSLLNRKSMTSLTSFPSWMELFPGKGPEKEADEGEGGL